MKTSFYVLIVQNIHVRYMSLEEDRKSLHEVEGCIYYRFAIFVKDA